MAGQVEAQAELDLPPNITPPMPVVRASDEEPWLNDTRKMWVMVIVGVLVFALFVDWFRMKVTPTKKVVDEAKVEQLAHDMADMEVAKIKEKLEAATRPISKEELIATGRLPAPTSPPDQTTPQAVAPTPTSTVANSTPPAHDANWKAALNELAKQQGVSTSPASPTTRAVRNEAYATLAALNPVTPKDIPESGVTDLQIESSIRKGLNYLLDQFTTHRLKNVESYGTDIFPGVDAISVYAVLTAGQAIKDERVRAGTTLVKNMLDGLKELPMDGGKDTYARSLRIAALGVLNRKEDRLALDNDARWMLESATQGSFTYTHPQPGEHRTNGPWDNSNSQYGGLGLWAAAEAGCAVPNIFWKDMENHWTECQVKMSGGWGYTGDNGPATLAMTCAGTTMLMLARDEVTVEGSTANLTAPLSKPLARGLEWLDEGDHILDVKTAGHSGYTLYGLERAGLASGYKFFGKHDWYRELSQWALETQDKDGSWNGGDTQACETAFRLLFLSRGMQPIFMGKLRWDGNWSNRPRDVASLTRFAGKALERTLNWQVLGLQRNWTDWTDAPVLLITSDDAPTLSDSDVAKLRSYALAGGLIFTHAENGSAKFNAFASDLAKRMFPEYALTPLPETHGIYSAMIPMQAPLPALMGVSNGSRLLMVHSSTDLTKMWGAKMSGERNRPVASEMGLNVVVWATGKRDLRRRTDSAYVAERTAKPIGMIPVARLQYDGNWDPEPWGWVREARKFDQSSSIGLDVKPVEIVALEPGTAPLAHLTGTAAHTFTDAEVKAVRDYVNGGGVLLIDACGGSTAFADSARDLVRRAFPGSTPAIVGAGHPLMGHGQAWMSDIPEVLTRGDTSKSAGLTSINAGKGMVLLTDLDLSTGLLGTTVSGVKGYEPMVAEKLVRNAVIWAVWPEGAPPEPTVDVATTSVK